MRQPIIQLIHECLHNEDVSWDLCVSKSVDDIAKFIKTAKVGKTDVIAIYGGDGTLRAAAKSLMESKLPLCILPGGSGNVLSKALGISQSVSKNLKMLVNGNYDFRTIDVGVVDDEYFLVRLNLGFEAAVVERADRNLKKFFGMFAYAASGFEALIKSKPSRYEIVLDNKKIEIDGFSCTIASSSNLGVPGISLSSDIKIDDGLLDVLLIPKVSTEKLKKALLKITQKQGRDEVFKHWQAKEVRIKMNPVQEVHCDGEILNKESIHARILPKALKVIVPKGKA